MYSFKIKNNYAFFLNKEKKLVVIITKKIFTYNISREKFKVESTKIDANAHIISKISIAHSTHTKKIPIPNFSSNYPPISNRRSRPRQLPDCDIDRNRLTACAATLCCQSARLTSENENKTG